MRDQTELARQIYEVEFNAVHVTYCRIPRCESKSHRWNKHKWAHELSRLRAQLVGGN